MSDIGKKDTQLDTTGVEGELVKRLTDEDKKLALDVLKRLADEIRADMAELNDVPPSFGRSAFIQLAGRELNAIGVVCAKLKSRARGF